MMQLYCALVLLALAIPSFAADDEICLACHDDPTLQRVAGGIPQSLTVSADMIAGSLHSGLSCTDCHSDLAKVEDYPHPPNLAGVNCAECHSEAFKPIWSAFASIWFRAALPISPIAPNAMAAIRCPALQIPEPYAVSATMTSDKRLNSQCISRINPTPTNLSRAPVVTTHIIKPSAAKCFPRIGEFPSFANA